MISHRVGMPSAEDGASTARGGAAGDVVLGVADVALSEKGGHGAEEGGEGESPVNFDEAALVEIEIDGTDYRLDAGRAGTALCISTRRSGTWTWSFRGEARWQANVLKCKAFDRSVLLPLGKALAEAAAATD